MRIIVFEGPDCSGKTTQAKLLAQSLKKAIYVHMPRTFKTDVKTNYKNTVETIFNENFMNSILNDNDERKYKLQLLERILLENIDINAKDKIDFMNFLDLILNSLVDPRMNYIDSPIAYDLLFEQVFKYPETYSYYVEGDLVKEIDIDKERKNDDELVLILDRFDISGICYNEYIPSSILDEYCNRTTDEELKESFKNIKFKLKLRQEMYNNEINRIKNHFVTYYNIYFQYVFFYSSEFIKNETIKNNRELTSYDKNNFISKYSKEYYTMFIDALSNDSSVMLNSIYFNTDEIIKNCDNESESSISRIRGLIYRFANIYKKLLRTEFDNAVRTIH
jgi:thymidylate kinase